jgi:hypothetical protein
MGIGISATEDGDLLTYTAHASPYDSAVATSNRLAARAAIRTHKENLQAIKRDLLQCETNIAQVAQALPVQPQRALTVQTLLSTQLPL